MEQVGYSALRFFLVSGVEAAAFLCVAVFALRRRRGVVGVLAVLAGVLGALSAGTFAAAWAQVQWGDSFAILEAITTNSLLEHLDGVKAAGVALLAVAFIASRRAEQHRA